MSERGSLVLRLPLPPSVNRYWRVAPIDGTHRPTLSAEGREFKKRIATYAPLVPRRLECDLFAAVMFYTTRARDSDNGVKPLFDALQGVAYINDRQIVEHYVAIVRGAVSDETIIKLVPLDGATEGPAARLIAAVERAQRRSPPDVQLPRPASPTLTGEG